MAERYKVGEQVAFLELRFLYGGDERREGNVPFNYKPREDVPTKIQIKVLTCKEHHKVPTNVSEEATADGFLFEDSKGVTWFNQYPRASYGQLSDVGDWMVHSAPEKNVRLERMVDLAYYLECILEGLKRLDVSTMQHLSIRGHYNNMVRLAEGQGLSVKEGPLRLVSETHGVEVFPDITKVTIEPKSDAWGAETVTQGMTAHQLAKALMDGPDLPVMIPHACNGLVVVPVTKVQQRGYISEGQESQTVSLSGDQQ